MNWTAVEDALVVWAIAGTGLAAVIWGDQEGPHPTAVAPGPNVVMTLMGLAPEGQDFVQVEDVETPAPLADVAHVARGSRTGTLRVECFAGGGTSALAGIGSGSPKARLEQMVSARYLPTVDDALRAANVGVLSMGAVQSIPGVLGFNNFEPRALLEVRLSLASEKTELGTWIETTEIQQVDDEDDPVGGPVIVTAPEAA